MGLFDDIPMEPSAAPKSAGAPPSKGGGLFDDIPNEKPAASGWADAAKSLGSGLARGAVGLAGIPGDIAQLVDWGSRRATAYGMEKVGLLPEGKTAADAIAATDARRAANPNDPGFITTKRVIDAASNSGVPGLDYQPETRTGEYARTIGEFIPAAAIGGAGPLARLGNVVKYGVIPGAAVEAVRPAAESGALPAWAPAAAGIVAGGLSGLGSAIATRPSVAERAVASAARRMTPEQLADMERKLSAGLDEGVSLTRGEASGNRRLLDLQRVVEGQGGLGEFMAQRPAQVEQYGRRVIGGIAETPTAPSRIGPAVADAAKAALADTPEGRQLADQVWRAGPRVTAEEAGNIIQPELRGVYDRREGMRAALADQEYAAARNAPATVPLDGGFGFRDVTSHYLPPEPYPVVRGANGQMRKMTPAEIDAAKLIRPVPQPKMTRSEGGKFQKWGEGEKAAAEDAAWQDILAKRAQQQKEINITERMPVIGLAPTKFGQADVSTVAQHLDEVMQTAKGMTKQALTAARRAIETPSGELDYSITGLDNARKAITDLISQAKLSGANNAVRELEGALGTLDQALEKVPAYGQARRGFAAASEPLAPFGEGRAPGDIVARDQFEKRFAMPAEQAPRAIEKGGASAAQDFADIATEPARDAYAKYLTTKALDQAGRNGADVSSKSIRDFMRENEDALRRFPDVQQRLESVAASRDALEPLMAGPIGKLSGKPEVSKAIEALFPRNPVPNSAGEVKDAVSALSAKNPWAARQLVRAHVESVFNQAKTDMVSGGLNQFRGSAFKVYLTSNPQNAANVAAAIRGLPNGDAILPGFDRMLEIMAATGQRQRIGSQTAFNQELQAAMKTGGVVGEGTALAAGAGLKLPARILERYQQWNIGRNVDELARLLTEPAAAKTFAALASAPKGSAKAAAAAARLVYIARDGAEKRTDRK